jgi:CarD family transcriptional regulator
VKGLKKAFYLTTAIWLGGGVLIQILINQGGNVVTLMNVHTLVVTGFGSLSVLLGAILVGVWINRKLGNTTANKNITLDAKNENGSKGSLRDRDMPDRTLDRWNALIRYDSDLRTAAKTLAPLGDMWVDKLRVDYFALNEDKKYLQAIVQTLLREASQKQVPAQPPSRNISEGFTRTFDGERCTENSLQILERAKSIGYTLEISRDETITASKGTATSYLRSNSDILRFGTIIEEQLKRDEDIDSPANGHRTIKPDYHNLEVTPFNVGDSVVYPAHGVGKILAIEEQQIGDLLLKLFVINFLEDKMTLRVPTSKVANVGMRGLSDRKSIQAALERLRQPSSINNLSWAEQADDCEARINSGDITSISDVIRELHAVKPEQPYSQKQLYEVALKRFSGEVAAVENISSAEAENLIKSKLANSALPTPLKTDNGKLPTRVSVDFGAWEIERSEIYRVYKFKDLAGPGSETEFLVKCRLIPARDPAARERFTPFIYFVSHPYIMEPDGFLAALFAPSDSPVDFRIINVKLESTKSGGSFILVTQDDAQQCLEVLLLGRQIVFRLLSGKEQLAWFSLENDASFKRNYRHLLDRMTLES